MGWRVPRAVPIHPGTLVLSAAGLPGPGRWGDNSEASLLFSWRTGFFSSHTPSLGLGGRACPRRDMAWREARGLGHPRREPRSQNPSWSGVNGGPEKLASTSREPGPLDGRDEGQPLPELVGWAASGGSGLGVNTRALRGARPGWGQGQCPAWGPAASPRSPSTDLLGSGALGLEEGWESPRKVLGRRPPGAVGEREPRPCWGPTSARRAALAG